jgi:hypothetical protein
MLYTRLGRIVVVLALVIGIWQVVGGFLIAIMTPEDAAATARYFGRFQSTGELISRGTYIILFAIALGILTEISRSVHRIRELSDASLFRYPPQAHLFDDRLGPQAEVASYSSKPNT